MGSRTKSRKKDKKKDKRRAAKGPPLAEQADKYDLYQRSVQEPEVDVEFMVERFRDRFGRDPVTLREDFCGAANLACHWAKLSDQHEVWGVDLDPECLAWGREHNLSQLDEGRRARVHLVEGDVLDPREPRVDVITAQNFSYCTFKTREQLRRYFEVVREGLRDEGLFVMDLFGGPEAQTVQEEETVHDDFSYVWDQDAYNPITNEILCYIHFRFRDRSRIERAFTYDWRLWTIAELRELLAEAGFSASEAYWEGADEDGEGNGEFTKTETVENEDAWIAYVIGVR